jgi:hypothetical protein
MPQKIQLNRNLINKIQGILTKFNDVEFFSLVESDSNGIGTILDMEFQHTLFGDRTKIVISLSDVEDW